MNLELSGSLLDGMVAVCFWIVLIGMIVGAFVIIAVRLVRDIARTGRSIQNDPCPETRSWPDAS